MPGTSTTGSTNIAVLDSKIIADLCAGKFYIDASPSVYIADGAENVLGANVEIINPYGVTVKPYGDNYEVAPGLSDGMNGVISFNIPTLAGGYQYGDYIVNVKLFDGENSWVVTKKVSICAPDKDYKSRKYGSLSAKLDADCVNGKVYVFVDPIPNYKGKTVESQSLSGTLDYPTASGLEPLSITTGNFSVQLYEGVYKLVAETCVTYNFGDNVYVKVLYKIKKEKSIRCLIDMCCVLTALKELQSRIDNDCTDEQKAETASIIVEALSLLRIAELAANCGEDASEYIADLEELLGCKCTCNCAEGAPIIGNSPTGDFVIEGCNVETSEDGNTTTYTFNNYEYVVEIAENGGVLVAAAPTLNGCTKTQVITFNIETAYSQIKDLADATNTEADFWATLISKSLRDANPSCLGLTSEQWQALTFAGKFQAVLTKLCNCCSACEGTIEDPATEKIGANVHLTWGGNAYAYHIYLDGVFVGSYLQSAAVSGVFTHIFVGAADGKDHTWIIEALCADKSQGAIETGDFGELGCATIPTPSVGSAIYAGENCPFDLTGIILGNAGSYEVEYHNANDTTAATLVPDPTQVLDGIYYIFFKDEEGCYSMGTKITVTCDNAGCTAPQNLTVTKFATCNFFVQFQSPAYPPPSGNGYTVKRRLASDPDVGGSYTEIGSPTWNASFNRWVICDFTGVANTLYVYRAESNCDESAPYIDYYYAYIICPGVTTYPTSDSISYSFVPVAGASQIIVELLDGSGVSVLDSDTYVPAFDDPIEGIFEYLEPDTSYKLRLRIKFTSGDNTSTKTCTEYNITTDPAP